VKATEEAAMAVREFLMDHPAIRRSPSDMDTLLVRGRDGKKNVRVPRMLMEVCPHGALQGVRQGAP